jgi:peptide/nickel transport system substrate-binding protein
MWRPLWWVPTGASPTIDYSQSIGGPAVFSHGNSVVTVHLHAGWKWSDGAPVTAQDLAFDYWLTVAAVKLNPANDGNYTQGLYPDGVTSVATPNPTTFVIDFEKSYNPGFVLLDELQVLEPLPVQSWSRTAPKGKVIPFDNLAAAEAIYKFLDRQSRHVSTWSSNPLWRVVDGPFRIDSYDPATGANVLAANPAYTGPVRPRLAGIENLAFPSVAAEFAALLAGKVDVGYVDFADMAQVKTLEADGYDVWGYPYFGFSYVAYNFKDPTGYFEDIIDQLYVRQALAHLQDQPAEVESPKVFDGAAGEDYGPVPAEPRSPFTPGNDLSNPYPFSIAAAAKLLSSHGWKVVPNGTTTCQRPGTSSSECGSAIPQGAALSWDLYYASTSAVTLDLDKAWATNALQVGVRIKLVPASFNYITGELSDPGNPANAKVWAMEDFGGFNDAYYPTTNGLFNSSGSFNQGGFSDPLVDKDVLGSAFSSSSSALTKELYLVTLEQPGLFQPEEDRVTAFKDTLGGPPASFEGSSQLQFSPEYWYFKQPAGAP